MPGATKSGRTPQYELLAHDQDRATKQVYWLVRNRNDGRIWLGRASYSVARVTRATRAAYALLHADARHQRFFMTAAAERRAGAGAIAALERMTRRVWPR